jgi:Maltokinase N-terminal cap domain
VALIHKATLIPTKLEALTAWLPGRSWLGGADVRTLTQVGSYRFDDPAGEVGIETLLVRTADGRLLQVPLSYRAAPLAGADHALVTTMHHSVLGPRWVYDGCADPVAVWALAAAILTGGHEAELEVDTGAGMERREPTVRVVGSGTPPAAVPELTAVAAEDGPDGTTVSAGALVLTVRRWLDGPEPATAGAQTLYGTWDGTDRPVLLAMARPA